MSVIQMHRRQPKKARPSVQRKAKRVYAIAFDLDSKVAETLCGANWRGTCYAQIKAVMEQHGFGRMQGSVYFGDESSDAVRCFLAVRDLDNKHAWFGRVVRDLRMLRVDEDNDLLPLLSNRLRLGDSEAA
jgi:virulence-associated protein VapD